MDILLRCPGLYCGRILQADGNWSDCGACPRGFRSNSSSACVPCEDVPMFYDWLYLGFMALIALVLHWSCIDSIALHFSIVKKVIVLHILAFLEMVTAALATLKIINPDGLFDIKSCRVNRLSDWYTLMHNPTPNYDTNLHCTQEAVYPLLVCRSLNCSFVKSANNKNYYFPLIFRYTIVFVFYAMCVVNMLLIRTIIVNRFFPKKGKYTIYAALYFFPLLALLHAIAGGLICEFSKKKKKISKPVIRKIIYFLFQTIPFRTSQLSYQ